MISNCQLMGDKLPSYIIGCFRTRWSMEPSAAGPATIETAACPSASDLFNHNHCVFHPDDDCPTAGMCVCVCVCMTGNFDSQISVRKRDSHQAWAISNTPNQILVWSRLLSYGTIRWPPQKKQYK